MTDLLKKIREHAQTSQNEMAKELGVSFATINRWENGHVYPNNLAQDRIYEFCLEHSIPLYDLIIERIKEEAEKIKKDKNHLILYHGSKSGLKGKIKPISRDICDFGRGFYMGDEPGQALTLICDYLNPEFYIVSVNIRSLNCIEIPADIKWAMLVSYYRGRMEKIKDTALYDEYSKMINNQDLVIGRIADDRMFYVMDDFFSGLITDQTLVESLSALQLGKQYVAVTEKGCDRIKIEKKIELSHLEMKCLKDISSINRLKGIEAVETIRKKNRRKGKYFDEILSKKGGN